MNIDPQQVHSIRVTFDAGSHVPPPYHYAYQLEVNLAENGTPGTYEIKYLHREELTEEEIFDEGFTLEDDWEWQGSLPENWREAIKTQIQKQSWPKKPELPDAGEPVLIIRLLDADNKEIFEGSPADPSTWDYFLQELIQAIFEIGEKEAPFFLEYREISSGKGELAIQMEASFAQRTIVATKIQDGKEAGTATPDWKELKQLMKVIYLPDYDYDQARVQEPKKRGKYLYTGEGLWFKFGEGLKEPNKNSDSLERLEKELKELF